MSRLVLTLVLLAGCDSAPATIETPPFADVRRWAGDDCANSEIWELAKSSDFAVRANHVSVQPDAVLISEYEWIADRARPPVIGPLRLGLPAVRGELSASTRTVVVFGAGRRAPVVVSQLDGSLADTVTVQAVFAVQDTIVARVRAVAPPVALAEACGGLTILGAGPVLADAHGIIRFRDDVPPAVWLASAALAGQPTRCPVSFGGRTFIDTASLAIAILNEARVAEFFCDPGNSAEAFSVCTRGWAISAACAAL